MSNFFMLLSVTAVRTLIVMIVVTGGLRLLGKRQLGQMNVYDFAMIMLVANAVQNAMTAGKGNLIVGVSSAGILLVVGALVSIIVVRVPSAERLIAGTPTVLVSNGELMKRFLDREHISLDELMAAIREHELHSILEVKLAVLEVNGDISIIAKEVTKPNVGKSKDSTR